MRARTKPSKTRPTGLTHAGLFGLGQDDLPRWSAVGANGDVRSIYQRVGTLESLGQIRVSSFAGSGFLALLPPGGGSATKIMTYGHDEEEMLPGHEVNGYCAIRFVGV